MPTNLDERQSTVKLLFSEAAPDYGHYIFPYAVWAFPEPGEVPADLFNSGFLPSARNLDRFYLCRQVRVRLPEFRPSSENRRILRKGQDFAATLVPRARFDYTPQRREFYKNYADVKFGKEVMSRERLDALFQGRIISHLLLFTDARTGAEIGTVTLYLEPPAMAYYYYAFYDLAYFSRNLGMFMMTWAVAEFARRGFGFLYLGSCYRQSALYKTQFSGAQFFNGLRWSANLQELKYLVARGESQPAEHLLEAEDYRQTFSEAELPELAARSPFGGSAK
jgi:arginyl-tRNA--protein-N-Asp/Glu arginylyltransferase